MIVSHKKHDKASFMLFEDVFNTIELKHIWQEAMFLCHERKFSGPSVTGSAIEDNEFIKNNKGIWLDKLYSDRKISNYLSLYRKPFDSILDQKDKLIDIDFNMKLFYLTSADVTLLSYYEDSDYYKSHTDNSCYTYIFWLFREPKLFSGGDLVFPELDLTINVKSNMAILFPSWLDHKVDNVSICDTIEKFNCNGRFSFTTFFKIED